MRRFKHVCDMFKTSSWARANAASYFFKDQRRRLDQISIDLGIENKAATSPEWRFEAVGMENWLVATKHLLPMLDQVLYRVLEILMTEGQSKGLKTGFYWNKWLPYCEHYTEEYMNDLVRFCRLLKDKEQEKRQQEKREREKEAREKRMQGRRRWGN